MSVKRLILSVIFFLTAVSAINLLFNDLNSLKSLVIEVASPVRSDTYQVFYDIGNGYNEKDSVQSYVNKGEGSIKIAFDLPGRKIMGIRIDPGNNKGDILIKSISLKGKSSVVYTWAAKDIMRNFRPLHQIAGFSLKDDAVRVRSAGEDPYLASTFDFKDVYGRGPEHRALKIFLYVLAIVLSAYIYTSSPVYAFLSKAITVSLEKGTSMFTNKKVIVLAMIFLGLIYFISEISLLSVSVEIASPKYTDKYQLFYDTGEGFNEHDSTVKNVFKSQKDVKISFQVPPKEIEAIRIDPGSNREGIAEIRAISFGKYRWPAKDIVKDFKPLNDIGTFKEKNGLVYIKMTGDDPFFTYNKDFKEIYLKTHGLVKRQETLIKLFLSVLSLLLMICLSFFDFNKLSFFYRNKIEANHHINKALNFLTVERAFLIIAIIFGVSLAFIVPPFQAADEGAHFYRAFELSEFNIIGKQYSDRVPGDFLPESVSSTVGGTMQDVAFHPYKKVAVGEVLSYLNVPINPRDRKFVFIPTVLYSPIPYIPQTIGIVIGKMFVFSPLLLMYTGRLFNLFAWAFLVFLSIQILPFFKYVFLLLALTPMSLFQSASLSADAVTNGLSFLLIAFFLRYAFDDNKAVKRTDIVSIIFLVISVSLLKPFYFILAFLFLLIPVAKIGSKGKYWVVFLILIATSMVPVLGWAFLTRNFNPINPLLPYVNSISVSGQLHYIVLQPLNYCRVICNTLVENHDFYLQSFIGHLGWGEVVLPRALIYLYSMILTLTALMDNTAARVTFNERVLAMFVFVISSVCIISSLYLVWTPVGGGRVLGVVGRNFIPISPLLFLVLYNNIARIRYDKLKTAAILGFIVYVLIVTVSTIIIRYYL